VYCADHSRLLEGSLRARSDRSTVVGGKEKRMLDISDEAGEHRADTSIFFFFSVSLYLVVIEVIVVIQMFGVYMLPFAVHKHNQIQLIRFVCY